MKLRMMVVALTIQLFAPVLVSAQTIEPYFVKGNRLSYKGYSVTSSYNSTRYIGVAVIRKNGRVLTRMKETINGQDSTRMGLVTLLGGKTKQLIIEQSSGGNKCCFYYRIYELFPRLHLIFNSEKYPIGDGFDELKFLDVDKDGVLEFTQESLTIAFAEWLSYPASPLPTVIFKYDSRTREYLPANHRFVARSLRGIKQTIARVKAINNAIAAPVSDRSDVYSEEYLASVLDVFFTYLYAGKERQAWSFYTHQYKLEDKLALKNRISGLIRKDAIYRAIYAASHSHNRSQKAAP